MARVTTVRTSIGSDTNESVTVNSAYTGTDGTITLSATVPAAVKVGDVIDDSAGNGYLITAISGAELTCQDYDSTTDPATGAATIREAYSTITLWEADLDAGTNSEVYKSGDDAVGEVYNNSTFDEGFTINGGGTIGLASRTLTVPESERHDGTAGTGARVVQTAAAAIILQTRSNNRMEWLEFDAGAITTGSTRTFISVDFNNTRYTAAARNLLVHNLTNGFHTYGVATARGATLHNSIIYDITNTHGGGSVLIGVRGTSNSGGYNDYLNLTVHNITNNGGSASTSGLSVSDNAVKTVKNSLVTDVGGTSSGSKTCFNLASPANATMDHNASSDTTASGTGSLTSIVTADQYVSTVVGSEDLHLKSGSDCIGAGADLGTTPTGVNFDIDGRDRDAEVDVWDIGADQFVAAAAAGNPWYYNLQQQLAR